MIKLYTNRELSEKLGVNLAKWKRWSREFLPPDPLGGLQSGFARQYYFRDAFIVMLGGHLVSDLHFSVFEAKRIMDNLNDWFMKKGFYQVQMEKPETANENKISTYKIFVQHYYTDDRKQIDFEYRIRGIILNKPVQNSSIDAREERYVEEVLHSGYKKQNESEMMYEKIINISSLYNIFIEKLGYN
jgi:hypothetical protein